MKTTMDLFALLAVLSTLSLDSAGQDQLACPYDLRISALQNGIVLGETDIIVQGGVPARFDCVSGCDQSVTIEISCRTQSSIEMRPSNSGGGMTFNRPPQDLESCTCRATHLDDNSTSFPLTVKRAFYVMPVLSLSLETSVPASNGVVTVQEGSTGLTLTCMLSGFLDPTTYDIGWLKDGTYLTSEDYTKTFIFPMRREDSGNYTCAFLNGNTLLSDSLTISVTAADPVVDNRAVIAASVCSAIGALIIMAMVVIVVHMRRCRKDVYSDDVNYIIKLPEKNGRY